MYVYRTKNLGLSCTILWALLAYLCITYIVFSPRSIYTGKIAISTDVGFALSTGKPVLALESTIITHGMPYPINTETAKAVEEVAKAEGVCPATIAIVNGVPHIGLNDNVLDFLGKQAENHIIDGKNVKFKNDNIIKVSRREIGYTKSKKINGGTTVSATMLLADLAGIKVFSTGGIGGAHKYFSEGENDEDPLDISTDLHELSMTNVCVVSAGPKAILNLPRTMEILETYGVPVVGYQTNVLPAFWSRSTNPPIKLYQTAQNPAEAASFFLELSKGLENSTHRSGMLLVNPIPEEDALSPEYISGYIDSALKAANDDHIKGKEITPYLLQKMLELTDGKSIIANIALVKNNVKVGAQMAKSLVEIGPFSSTISFLNDIFNKKLMNNIKLVEAIRKVLYVIRNPLFYIASVVYYILEKTVKLDDITIVYVYTSFITYIGLLFVIWRLFITIAGENPLYERKRLSR